MTAAAPTVALAPAHRVAPRTDSRRRHVCLDATAGTRSTHTGDKPRYNADINAADTLPVTNRNIPAAAGSRPARGQDPNSGQDQTVTSLTERGVHQNPPESTRIHRLYLICGRAALYPNTTNKGMPLETRPINKHALT